MAHKLSKSATEERKRRAFAIWDYEGEEYPLKDIKDRLGVGRELIKKWKAEWRENKVQNTP